MKRIWILVVLILMAGDTCPAEDKKKPTAVAIVTGEVVMAASEPQGIFIGTIYYTRLSRVASEAEGLVEEVRIEEGARVKGGQKLLQLRTDLLETRIRSTRATHEQLLVEVEKAGKDHDRMASLFEEDAVSEVILDDHRYRKRGLLKRAAALRASLEGLLLAKKKKTVTAPFDGIVIRKLVEKGEWVAAGGKVLHIAADNEVDILVDVPATVLPYLQSGLQAEVAFNGSRAMADFLRVIPCGDITTRTFSVKLRLKNRYDLIEGMEARVRLPVGAKSAGLHVPRDAVVKKGGKAFVFLVKDNTASMVPVTVTGRTTRLAGIRGKGLSAGLPVVVKGNERLRNGQAVRIVDS